MVEIRPYTTDEAELRGDREWTHVAVMPSVVEGYGLVGSEAAAQGIPVLVNAESGVGQFLADESRIPARLGQHCVVPDQGLAQDRGARVQAWAGALTDLAADYPARRAAAGELREVLTDYSWTNAAQGFRQAVSEAKHGARRHTVQESNGAIRVADGQGQNQRQGQQAATPAPADRDFVARFTQDVGPCKARPRASQVGRTARGPARVRPRCRGSTSAASTDQSTDVERPAAQGWMG